MPLLASEPHWTSYVGMASGSIGAITGIAGAIMGYISYRKSNQLKSLDLRLELKKSITVLHSSHSRLIELIEHANRSRIAVSAATSRSGSGIMDKWKNNIESDKTRIAELSEKIPEQNNSYENLDTEELESKLIEVHAIQTEINQLNEKYNASITEDDNQRNHLREDIRHRHVTK
jgi:hypothetical protein